MLQTSDPRNQEIMVFVKDQLYPRQEAKISVFDSSVQGGDAVWEGIRVYEEGIFLFDRHLDRMVESAHALAFAQVPSREWISDAVFQTLRANDMRSDTHIRLTLTRGEKITSGMDPRLNQAGCTLIVLAEWKKPVYKSDGIRIITSTIRRNAPQFLDSKIHHNNLLNNIQAKIQANVAGVDAALMLDQNGFASELNGTNVFMVKGEHLLTPHADACLPGITRAMVMKLASEAGIPVTERNISLTELYNADMVFATGSMGELTPVLEIDGRSIKNDQHMFRMLMEAFVNSRKDYCTPIPGF